jgi:hypothetical protein
MDSNHEYTRDEYITLSMKKAIQALQQSKDGSCDVISTKY